MKKKNYDKRESEIIKLADRYSSERIRDSFFNSAFFATLALLLSKGTLTNEDLAVILKSEEIDAISEFRKRIKEEYMIPDSDVVELAVSEEDIKIFEDYYKEVLDKIKDNLIELKNKIRGQ